MLHTAILHIWDASADFKNAFPVICLTVYAMCSPCFPRCKLATGQIFCQRETKPCRREAGVIWPDVVSFEQGRPRGDQHKPLGWPSLMENWFRTV